MTEQHNRTEPNRTEQNSGPGTEQKTEQAGGPRKGGPAVRFDVPEHLSRTAPVRLFVKSRYGKVHYLDGGTVPHVTRDGRNILLRIWTGTCPKCGEEFQTRTTLGSPPVVRRCERHRKLSRSTGVSKDPQIAASVALAHAVAPAMREAARRERERV